MGSGVWGLSGLGRRPRPARGRRRAAILRFTSKSLDFATQNRASDGEAVAPTAGGRRRKGSTVDPDRPQKSIAVRRSTEGRPRSTSKVDRRKAVDRRSTSIDLKIDRRKAIESRSSFDREAIENVIAVRRS